MSEQLLIDQQVSDVEAGAVLDKATIAGEAGKISLFQLLAEESPNVTTTMTWQSAWSNKEDR